MHLSDRVRSNVRLILEAKAMSYSDLGWDRRYVGHMLRGDKGFSAERIQDFADALNVDVSLLCVRPVSPAEEG